MVCLIFLKNFWDVIVHTLPLLPQESHCLRRSRTKKNKQTKNLSRVFRSSARRRACRVRAVCSAIFSPAWPLAQASPAECRREKDGAADSHSRASPSVASTPGGRRSCQSLSMSLYFLRRMETWSLKRTGSSLIWEWTSGMAPNQLANLFMQVCRWAKWSGSAQREAREDCEKKQKKIENEKLVKFSFLQRCNTICSILQFSLVE